MRPRSIAGALSPILRVGAPVAGPLGTGIPVLIASATGAGSGTLTVPGDGWYRVLAQGPGGQGGQAYDSSLGTGNAGGGGAGGLAISPRVYLTAGQTIAYTIGAGCAVVADGMRAGASPTTATTATLPNGTVLTGNPGSGGAAINSSANAPGGAGGTATGGQYNFTGRAGNGSSGSSTKTFTPGGPETFTIVGVTLTFAGGGNARGGPNDNVNYGAGGGASPPWGYGLPPTGGSGGGSASAQASSPTPTAPGSGSGATASSATSHRAGATPPGAVYLVLELPVMP